MKGNGMNIEELLFDDAEKIEIDQDFKQSLKQRIMSQELEPKVKVNRYSTKYLKIASGFVVVVLISGGIISMLKTGTPGTIATKTKTEINTTDNGKTEMASMTNTDEDSNKSRLPQPSNSDANQQNNQIAPTQPDSSNKPNVQNKDTSGAKTIVAENNNNGSTAPSSSAGNSNVSSTTNGNNTTANTGTNTVGSNKGIQAINILSNEQVTRLPGVIGTPLSPGPDKNGQQSSSISPDGKYLTFEENNKIYMMKTGSDQKVYVDDGNKPSWYITDNIISYVKDDVEKDLYGKTSSDKSLYVEKHNSSIWIYDIASDKKYKLMGSQVPDKAQEVKAWAESVKSSDTDQSFTIRSKETYLSTVWAQNSNKELFVVMNDNVLSQVEYFKLTLQIER